MGGASNVEESKCIERNWIMRMQASSPGVTVFEVRRPPSAWFMGLGVALTVLGAIAAANLAWATAATVYLVGVLMFAGGVLQLFHAIGTRRWGRTLFWTLSGLLYLAAATCVMLDPRFAAQLLILCLAFALVASGVIRCTIALGERGHGWGWLLVSGVISIAAGAIMLLGGGINAVWILGLVLAIDLLIQGVTLIVVGIIMRRAADRG